MATTPTPATNGNAEKFVGQPYLQHLKQLQHAFPPVQSFLKKISSVDEGRRLVETYYRARPPVLDGVPGRCICLEFDAEKVTILGSHPDGFASPADLAGYLSSNPAKASRVARKRRLFILEDLEPNYVDVLGHHLGVDPLIFSEQMNTWNFTDSRSIPHRSLPSMSTPKQSLTLRYYEIRTLDDAKSIGDLTFQMTFAINRRRYERWRDIDLKLAGDRDKRYGFIRRCASFWTSQEVDKKDQGWDALLLVDPGMSRVKAEPDSTHTTYILKDPTLYKDRAGLWNSNDWDSDRDVEAKRHKSYNYHDGCPTLAQVLVPHISDEAQHQMMHFSEQRDLASPFDEQVFYWTKVASKNLIRQTIKQSSNSAYYLLKHVAQHWTNQLELINCTVAQGEYLSDDYQATIDENLSQRQWKADLNQVNSINKDINYMRRQMNHFWRAMVLNLERLGVQLGCEQVEKNFPLAIRDAQKDFLTIHARMQPLRERGEGLAAISNDLANLRAAFRGVKDGEFGLRLSLFASIVFPLTLVAGIFSMNDVYLPGAKSFWKLWAVSLPLVAAFALVLVYGRHPFRVLSDAKEYCKALWRGKAGNSESTSTSLDRTKKQGLRKRLRAHVSVC
ncbi:hypothetical protein FKW77_001366 [Venturia effusa]|uniref:Uncharacterized protein n=1 Tax=Venturia effusa TaxID=50376 RepID=A0A517LND9_9PEZI|nr:hypothetical protein FKW77_001366 [Venturia effusa]